jgi:hypothetical protein
MKEDFDIIEMSIDFPISGFLQPCPACLYGTVEYRGSCIDDDTHYMYPWQCNKCGTYWLTGDLLDAVVFNEVEEVGDYAPNYQAEDSQATRDSICAPDQSNPNS